MEVEDYCPRYKDPLPPKIPIISVTELLRFLPASVMMQTKQLYAIKNVRRPRSVIAGASVEQDREQVSDLTGIAVTCAFELS